MVASIERMARHDATYSFIIDGNQTEKNLDMELHNDSFKNKILNRNRDKKKTKKTNKKQM